MQFHFIFPAVQDYHFQFHLFTNIFNYTERRCSCMRGLYKGSVNGKYNVIISGENWEMYIFLFKSYYSPTVGYGTPKSIANQIIRVIQLNYHWMHLIIHALFVGSLIVSSSTSNRGRFTMERRPLIPVKYILNNSIIQLISKKTWPGYSVIIILAIYYEIHVKFTVAVCILDL